VDLSGYLATVLRTSTFRESLRSDVFLRICGDLTAALHEENVPFMVMGGAAHGLASYPDPSLRHSHELDLLVRADHASRAEAVLLGRGLRRRHARQGQRWTTLVHETDMPVRLTTSLYPLPVYRSDWAAVSDRSALVRLGGLNVSVPGLADSLVQTSVDASYRPHRASLLWAADLLMISRAISDDAWQGVVDVAAASGTCLPVRVMLSYAREALEAPIPTTVLDELATRWSGDAVLRDTALSRATKGLEGGAASLLSRVESLEDRLLVARWLACPSPGFAKRLHGIEGAGASARWYGRRFVRGVVGLLRARSAGWP
jgi:hypothetical protein